MALMSPLALALAYVGNSKAASSTAVHPVPAGTGIKPGYQAIGLLVLEHSLGLTLHTSNSGPVLLLLHAAYLRTMPLATGKSASPPIESPISPVDLAPFRAEEGLEGREVVDLKGFARRGISG